MSLLRFMIDLAIKIDEHGNIPRELQERPTEEEIKALSEMQWIDVAKAGIKKLKSVSTDPLPPGQGTEITTTATVHICHHDVKPPLPCEDKQDI